MIEGLFVLTGHGDVLLREFYNRQLTADCVDEFMNFVRTCKSDETLQPEKEYKTYWFYHIKRNGLYFVAVGRKKLSSFLVIDILSKFYSLCKDFCGTVNEDSIRCNFLLVQELLMEFIDCGYPQLSTAANLKSYIFTEAVVPKCRPPIQDVVQAGLLGLERQELSSRAADKPILTKIGSDANHNEIFLDVIENLSVVVDKEGTVSRSEIRGQLNMKSFVSGNPAIQLALNEDLSVGPDNKSAGFGNSIHLDTCDIHNCANLDTFDSHRTIVVHPPQGEVTLMSYCVDSNPLALLPFRLTFATVSEPTVRDLDIVLTLRCQVPSSAKALHVVGYLPVPHTTTSVMSQLTGPTQTTEFDLVNHKIIWKIQNFGGSSDATAKLKLVGSNSSTGQLLQIGPLALEFELSAFACSGLKIRFVKIFEQMGGASSKEPFRWVRLFI